MTYEWNSLFTKNEMMRDGVHHLHYITHIAPTRLTNSN